MTSNENNVIIYGGTSLNKGGAAIASGTLKVLKELNVHYENIIDPDPHFPESFFKSFGVSPIYRYSNSLYSKSMKSINSFSVVNPFVKCLINSYKSQITQLQGQPIWHIGDSPFNDRRSSLSVVGQVFALESLQRVLGDKIIIGGVSLEYPKTKTGKLILKKFFEKVDFFFIRGSQTHDTLTKLGIEDERISEICDFAFHLNKANYNLNEEILRIFEDSKKPAIGLILRDFSQGIVRQNYISNLFSLIKNLEKTYDLFYIPTAYSTFLPENDLFFLEKELRISPSQIIDIKYTSPEEIISILGKFDAIISTRLHGAVFGALANVPTVHLFEDRKSFEVIGEIFKEAMPLINLSQFANDNNSAVKVTELIELLIEDKKIKDIMASNLSIARDKTKNKLNKSLKDILF